MKTGASDGDQRSPVGCGAAFCGPTSSYMPRFSPEILLAGGKTARSRRRWLCRLGLGLAAFGLSMVSAARAQMLVTHPGREGFASADAPSAPEEEETAAATEPVRAAGGSDILDQRLADGRQAALALPDRATYPGDSLWARIARERPFFYLNLGELYDDNIFVRRDKVGDFLTTIEPGLIVAYGNYRSVSPTLQTTQQVYEFPQDADAPKRFFYLDYHPTFYVFAKNDSEDSVDQSVLMLGSYDFARLTLSGQLQYQKLTDTNFDTSGRVDRSYYTAQLDFLYERDDKFSWEAKFYAQDREYQAPFVSSTEVQDQNFLNYKMGPKTTVSAGFGLGYIDYRPSTDQTYEQGLLRLHRTQSDKLDFTFTGGIEFRQSSGNKDAINGIFDLSLTYLYSANTTLTLNGTRETEPSAVINADETYTRVSLSLQQRLYKRLFLTVTGAYANDSYQRVSSGETTAFTRTDNVFVFFTSVDWVVNSTTTVQFSYQFRDSSSTESVLTYTQNVGGVYLRTIF